EAAFRRALAADVDFADAHLGLARTCARQRRWDEVVDCALSTLAIDHHRPAAHYLLGVALFNLNVLDRALLACRTAVEVAPGWGPAETWVRHLQHGTIRPPLTASHVRLRV